MENFMKYRWRFGTGGLFGLAAMAAIPLAACDNAGTTYAPLAPTGSTATPVPSSTPTEPEPVTLPPSPVATQTPSPNAGVCNHAFISTSEAVRLMFIDVSETVRSVDQDDIRYVNLTPIYNASACETELDIYRAALMEALEGASDGEVTEEPVAINSERTIYRLNLGELDLSATDWEDLAEGSPYTYLSWAAKTRSLENLVKTDFPFLGVEAFVSALSQPPFANSGSDVGSEANEGGLPDDSELPPATDDAAAQPNTETPVDYVLSHFGEDISPNRARAELGIEFLSDFIGMIENGRLKPVYAPYVQGESISRSEFESVFLQTLCELDFVQKHDFVPRAYACKRLE